MVNISEIFSSQEENIPDIETKYVETTQAEIDTTRRSVLKAGMLLAASTVAPNAFSQTPEKLYEESMEHIGLNELQFFITFFDLYNISTSLNQSIEKVLTDAARNIQKQHNVKADGIIGPQTLEILYRNYYAQAEKSRLTTDIQQRLEAMYYSDTYHKHPRSTQKYGKLFPKGKPPIFRKKYYHGNTASTNIEGTSFDQSLYGVFPETINKRGVYATIKKVGGRFALVVYDEGHLSLVCYASPGDPSIEGGIKTPTGKFNLGFHSGYRYKLTAAETSIKKIGKNFFTDYMPNAVHVEGAARGGVYVHAGNVDGSRKSHGCIRIPYKYSMDFFALAEKASRQAQPLTLSVQAS